MNLHICGRRPILDKWEKIGSDISAEPFGEQLFYDALNCSDILHAMSLHTLNVMGFIPSETSLNLHEDLLHK